MPSHPENILFDLDGTLADSQVGIFRCIHYAMDRLGAPLEEGTDLRWCVGPPLHLSLTRLAGGDAAQGARALELYRERYRDKGIFENRLYDGVEAVLSSLRKDFRLYLATSKPRVYALQVLEHFKIDGFFRGVYGSELDGTRTDKAELIRHLLDRERLDPARAVMVGDREHDMAGARQNNVEAVGAEWGYGSAEELRRAGAGAVLRRPSDLVAHFTAGKIA